MRQFCFANTYFKPEKQNQEIINNFSKYKQLQLDILQNIEEKFNLQYVFNIVSLIDDNNFSIQLKITLYRLLKKIHNDINLFKEEINKIDEYSEIEMKIVNENIFQLQKFYNKSKNIQNRIDQFQQYKKRIITEIIKPYDIFSEKQIIKYQEYFRQIIEDYVFKSHEARSGNTDEINFPKNKILEKQRSFIQINKKDDSSYHKKALILQQQQRFDEALIYFEKAIQLNPNNDNLYNNKGLILKKQGKLDEAMKSYDKVISINPNNYASHINKVVILRKLGRIEEAITLCDKAFQINPNDEKTYIQKGLALEQQGRASEAMLLFDIAITLNPKNFKAYIYKASILQMRGKYDEALYLYDQAIQLTPQNNCLYRQKASLLTEISRYDESIKCYDKAISLNGSDYKSYLKKAILLNQLGNDEGSQENFALYKRHIPSYKLTYDIIESDDDEIRTYTQTPSNQKEIIFYEGIFLKQQGNYEDAMQKFKEKLQIDPEDRLSLVHIGLCLQKLGRVEESLQLYRTSINAQS